MVYFFLFFNLFPDNGIVLKVITIYNQETESMEEVILEELQVFKVKGAVYKAYICLEFSAELRYLKYLRIVKYVIAVCK